MSNNSTSALSNSSQAHSANPGTDQASPSNSECCKGAAASECCKTTGAASSCTTNTNTNSNSNASSSGGCCGGSRSAVAAMTQPMTVDQLVTLPTMTLIARYRRGIECIDRRAFDLNERQIDQAYLPEVNVGRWPIRVLVGHVADAEIAYVHRMRRTVAEERPLLNAWDEQAFVDSNMYGNSHEGYADNAEADEARVMHALGGYLAVVHTLRQWTGQWLMTLDESAYDRVAMHSEVGEITLRRMLAYATWHLEHHAAFLTRKLDRLVPMPITRIDEGMAQTAAGNAKPSGGGCGSGCGCR